MFNRRPFAPTPSAFSWRRLFSALSQDLLFRCWFRRLSDRKFREVGGDHERSFATGR